MMKSVLHEDVARAISEHGMILRGGFHNAGGARLPDHVQTVFLVGNAGPEMYQAFRASGRDGQDALDHWTAKVLKPLARQFRAGIVFPFGGPDYAPFQHWAKRAEGLESSPIGILLHPHYGLWHAYRAALLFTEQHKLPPRLAANHACGTCRDRPCLNACPVSAFSGDAYDVSACKDHLNGRDEQDCMELGCASRHACPVGQDYAYSPAQAAFHMQAFRP